MQDIKNANDQYTTLLSALDNKAKEFNTSWNKARSAGLDAKKYLNAYNTTTQLHTTLTSLYNDYTQKNN